MMAPRESTDDAASIEVHAPGGWRGIFRGADTRVILLAFLFVSGVGAVYAWNEENRKLDRVAQTLYLDNHKMTQTLLAQVIANQRAIIDSLAETKRVAKEDIGEVVYVLSLPQEQRDKLRLEMPWSLRQKMNRTAQ